MSSYICPICNGMSILQATCSYCFHQLKDQGRIDQIWDPYSPYREIDDIKLTNGFMDYADHLCIHLASCPSCGEKQIVSINEQVKP